MSFKHLILQVSTVLCLEYNSSSLGWVFLSFAASADWITPVTHFQGWPSSFWPSVTRWSDIVYMQTYSWILRVQAFSSFCWQLVASTKATEYLQHCQARVGLLKACLQTWAMHLPSEGKNKKVKTIYYTLAKGVLAIFMCSLYLLLFCNAFSQQDIILITFFFNQIQRMDCFCSSILSTI